MFYDNSISPGAKIDMVLCDLPFGFYDNSISPGAKISKIGIKDILTPIL